MKHDESEITVEQPERFRRQKNIQVSIKFYFYSITVKNRELSGYSIRMPKES
jgi:hypothetical protein